jgi:dUTP pyrophosphatase
MQQIKVLKLEHGMDLPLPKHATQGSAGVDLMAAIANDVILNPQDRVLIPTGLSIYLPIGFEAQIRPRSGLALKNGITVLNSPGTIDSDYTGEVCVILINFGKEPFTITRGMRIAQMVIAPYTKVEFEEATQAITNLSRASGFGSTGL